MRRRAIVFLVSVLSTIAAGWTTVGAETPGAPTAEAPVVVGSLRVAAAELERAGGSRTAAADRAIERLWLEGEAAARGLRPAEGLAGLRGAVADALAGRGRLPRAARFAAPFDAFHERWRARTRCLPAYHDPYEDRCGDAAAGASGSCRWMGEATLCSVRRGWIVLGAARAGRAAARHLPPGLAKRVRRAGPEPVRLRSRRSAIVLSRAVYAVARAERARAAAARRDEEERAAAERAEEVEVRATAERAEAEERAAAERAAAAAARAHAAAAHADGAADLEREQRLRDPRLSAGALASALDACRRQERDSDPYMFGFGLQDVVGQAEGLIAARRALVRRLRAPGGDAIDRVKLRPLVDAVAAGNRVLLGLAAADAAGDGAAVAARVAALDARTEPERAVSRRLGLGDCLVRPAR